MGLHQEARQLALTQGPPQFEETVERTAKHEGYRREVYRCPAGKLTNGYGFNLDAGISEDEARLLLRYKLAKIALTLQNTLPVFNELNPTRQGVLVEMAYQMGVDGLLAFRRTIAHLARCEFADAAREMLQSKWAQQTPGRATALALVMERGT